MSEDSTYSVSQLSQLAGVSVRTLHYYDQIGLLKPQVRNDKGYRFYGYRQLVLLQQILIYRELDFSLDEIMKLLNTDDYDLLSALESQRLLLLDRQTSTQSMIESIEVTMTNLKAKQHSEIFFEGIPKDKAEDLREKATKEISDEDRNKFLQWLGSKNKEEVQKMKERSDIFNAAYKAIMHLPVEDPQVQELAQSHYDLMSQQMSELKENFKGIDYAMFIDMAEQTQNNAFFRDYFETAEKGMADHLRRALIVFAEKNLKV